MRKYSTVGTVDKIGAADVKKQLDAEISREHTTERQPSEVQRSGLSGLEGVLNPHSVWSFVALCVCCRMVFPSGGVDKGQHYSKTDEWCHTAVPTVPVYAALSAVCSVIDLFVTSTHTNDDHQHLSRNEASILQTSNGTLIKKTDSEAKWTK